MVVAEPNWPIVFHHRLAFNNHANHPYIILSKSDRYARQELIKEYQEINKCRLAVIYDALVNYSINLFEELVYVADANKDLHVLLTTSGEDGEIALRQVRSAHARCKELTVIVPDRANSGGTIFTIGADHILMGPTSDLGPVDPQLVIDVVTRQIIPAKEVIATVEAAEKAVQKNPETFPIHASPLANVNALMVQQAKSALARSGDLVKGAFTSVRSRSKSEVNSLIKKLQKPLIDASKSHDTVFSADAAIRVELPVEKINSNDARSKLLRRLWMKYFVGNERIFEGTNSSKVAGPWISESQ